MFEKEKTKIFPQVSLMELWAFIFGKPYHHRTWEFKSLFFFFSSLPFPPPDTSPTKQSLRVFFSPFSAFRFYCPKIPISIKHTHNPNPLSISKFSWAKTDLLLFLFLFIKKKNTSALSLNFLDSQRKGKTSRSSHNLLSWLVTTQLSGLKKKICFLKIISFLYSRKWNRSQ